MQLSSASPTTPAKANAAHLAAQPQEPKAAQPESAKAHTKPIELKDAMPLASPEVAADQVTEAPAANASSATSNQLNRLAYVVEGRREGRSFGGSANLVWTKTTDSYSAELEITASRQYQLLFHERMESEGAVSEDGLAPARFDRERQPPTADSWLRTDGPGWLSNEASGVSAKEAEPDQDPVSLLLQFAHVLSKLTQGSTSVDVRQMQISLRLNTTPIAFEVEDREILFTPIGELQTLRLSLRSRQDVEPPTQMQVWVASGYNYLPVRIRIHQGADSLLVLAIAQAPQISR
jgi:hypothetical protein